MKFFRQFESRLMNEAGEAEGGNVDAGMSSGDAFSQSSQASIGEDEKDVFARFGLDAKEYGFGEDETSEQTDEESQGSEEGEEAGQGNPDEKSFLNLVNSLGLVHNENPFQVESKDELKNLIQMGRDYTQKTQSLSEERKAWDSERSGAETELNGAIEAFNAQAKEFETKFQELEQWSFALNQLRDNAPDVFEEVQRVYSDTQKQFSNPVLDKQLASLRAEIAEAKKGLTSRENELILDKFETEKNAFSATEQSMKELGVNVDWKAVKDEWAKTGLPVNKVIGSIYFEQMAKAQASKSKVETTKAKVSAKPTGSAGSSRVGDKVKTIDPKLKGTSFANAVWDKFVS